MRKPISKKNKTKKLLDNLLPKNLFNKIDFRLVALGLVLAAGIWGYTRYGNVAIVNGKPISRIDYIKAMEKQVGKQVLDQMVNETLILDEAAKKGVTIDQATIDAEIAKVKTQVESQGQTLEGALQAEGMSQADLEKQIRIQKIVDQMSNSNAEVTQEQIDKFLAENKDSLPKEATKEELNDLAKSQIQNQNKNESINTWFENLRNSAKIEYK